VNARHLAASIASIFTALVLSPSVALADPPGDPRGVGDPRFVPASVENACNSLELAATGGPVPHDKKTLVVRWLGYATFELTYGDKVILLDNYYYRGPRYRDLGFKVEDVRRADAIIIGHGHFDHMSDSAQVAIQTGAPIVGAPITTTKLLSQAVNPAQVITVTGKGGELLHFDGFTVQPVLGRHGEPPAFTAAFGAAYTAAIPAPTPEQAAIEASIRAKGSSDSHILDQGTIAYIITFDTGFRLAYRDSGGIMTDYEKAAMQQHGRVDVLLGAIAANVIAESQATVLMPMVENYRPVVFFPGHHEEEIGGKVDRATEPMFQYIKNEFPDTVTVSKEFREPTCFDTRRNLSNSNNH
jgi:L-ascorbate metabolism protein UlaG (beta-lactamase superfamily)